MSCVVAGLSLLFKLSGLAIVLSLFLLILNDFSINKRKRETLENTIVLMVISFTFLSVFLSNSKLTILHF